MTVEITFAPEEEAKLRNRAAAAGKDVQTFVREAALEKADRPTLDEISGPVAQDFAASGMTDDELGDFLEGVKHKMRAERRGAKP